MLHGAASCHQAPLVTTIRPVHDQACGDNSDETAGPFYPHVCCIARRDGCGRGNHVSRRQLCRHRPMPPLPRRVLRWCRQRLPTNTKRILCRRSRLAGSSYGTRRQLRLRGRGTHLVSRRDLCIGTVPVGTGWILCRRVMLPPERKKDNPCLAGHNYPRTLTLSQKDRESAPNAVSAFTKSGLLSGIPTHQNTVTCFTAACYNIRMRRRSARGGHASASLALLQLRQQATAPCRTGTSSVRRSSRQTRL